jgi:hypothetical protein
MEWKTIESAPRDGTDILAWDGETLTVVCWDESLKATDAPSCWALYNRFATDAVEPTHWMPLPDPPGSTSTQEDR